MMHRNGSSSSSSSSSATTTSATNSTIFAPARHNHNRTHTDPSTP
eukprot:SAG22_NODE_6129_length_895_cov_1.271357_1_plen_44_part_10